MSVESTVCKFRCTAVEGESAAAGLSVALNADYDQTLDEDKRFSQATPSGTLTTFIQNPNLDGFFEVGKAYYLTITPADPITPAE